MTDAGHISDDDLERYVMGAVKDEGELAALEGHLLVCGQCIDRADEAREYVGTMMAALSASAKVRSRAAVANPSGGLGRV
jgi:hypothetical protein